MVKILNRLTQSDTFFGKIFLITAWKPKKMDIHKKERKSSPGVSQDGEKEYIITR